MRCPSCGVSFSTPPAECPNCKLTLEKLDRKFGLVPYCSRYLSDRSETLPATDIEDLRALLKPFEQKFPQIVFSVLVINLGENVSVSEYAFWLVNRARISSVNSTGPKNFDLFLVVDPKGRAAAMVAGYGLEKYVSEQDLQEALVGFRAGDLVRGIRECIEFMMVRLQEIVLGIESAAATQNSAVAVAVESDTL